MVSKGIVVNWNLMKNGEKIPIEPGCMDKIPPVLARAITREWFSAVVSLDSNLDQDLLGTESTSESEDLE